MLRGFGSPRSFPRHRHDVPKLESLRAQRYAAEPGAGPRGRARRRKQPAQGEDEPVRCRQTTLLRLQQHNPHNEYVIFFSLEAQVFFIRVSARGATECLFTRDESLKHSSKISAIFQNFV